MAQKEIRDDVAADALEILDTRLNLPLTTYLEACTHCGLCAEACHLYRADPADKHIPCFKADKVRKVYQRYRTPTGRAVPWLLGLSDLDEETLDDWVEPVFQCTMCRRCSIECPLGIDNAAMIATARAILLLLYVPLGKIYHMLLFFVSRALFGLQFGRRGVLQHDLPISY